MILDPEMKEKVVDVTRHSDRLKVIEAGNTGSDFQSGFGTRTTDWIYAGGKRMLQ